MGGRLHSAKRLSGFGLPPVGQHLQASVSAPGILEADAAKGKAALLRSLEDASPDREASWGGCGGQSRSGMVTGGQDPGRRKSQAAASKAGEKGFPEKNWIKGLVPRNTVSLVQQQQMLRGSTAPAPGQKRPPKNTAVWQRYQAQPRAGLVFNDTLERDRERQKSVISTDTRQTASPTKSRTAAIFFESAPGGDDSVYDCLPPGALRHVARPQLRRGPDRAATAAVANQLGAARRDSHVLVISKEMREINEIAVFEGNEDQLVEFGNALESYAALAAPPSSQTGSGGSPTGSISGVTDSENLREAPTVSLSDGREPMLQRPLFCRFLLASGLCGTENPELCYHEVVAAFDEQAMKPLSGLPSSLSRSTAVKVIAGIIWPNRGREDEEERSISQQMEFIATKKMKIQATFNHALPLAMDHCKARRRRLEDHRRGGSKEEPAEASGDDTQPGGKVWPPLPPRYITEKDLPAYMEGVQQWECELRLQNRDRLRALRSHTDAVLLGEVLVGQLLEPEVLHFSTRFRPLFKRLFDDYADWPVLARGPVLVPQDGKRVRCEHMSFEAFFKFCVDFGLFPKHASFEEIHTIYRDSEAVEPAARPEESSEARRSSKPSTPATGGRGTRQLSSRGSRKSLVPLMQREAEPGRRSQVERRRTRTMTPMTLAQMEASLPRVYEKLFDKPLARMSDLEVQCLVFLSSIGEWLGERFIRLADYVTSYMGALHEQEGEEAGSRSASPERRLLSSTSSGNLRRIPGLSGRRSTLAVTEEGKPASLSNSPEERKTSVSLEDSSIRSPTPCPAPLALSLTVSSKRFHELTLPMGTPRQMSEQEVAEMYRLLLTDSDLEDDRSPPDIPVFQLDKAVYKATRRMEQVRDDCCHLLRKDKDQSHSERVCCRFFEAFDAKFRERHRFSGDDWEDLFQGEGNVTPQELLEKAALLGVHEDVLPLPAELGNVFVQMGARSSSSGISKPFFWRLLAVIQERFRKKRQAETRTKMHCLAHTRHCGPGTNAFGLASFVECVLKLALHRLGSKGGSEIQRASPSWWKCAWLLTLLGGRYAEEQQLHAHYTRLHELATAPCIEEALPQKPRVSRSNTPGLLRSCTGSALPAVDLEEAAGESVEDESEVAKALTVPLKEAQEPWPSAPSTPALLKQQRQRLGSKRVQALTSKSLRTGSSAPSSPRTSSRSASAKTTPPVIGEPRLRATLRHMGSKELKLDQLSSGKEFTTQQDQLARDLDTWWRRVYARSMPSYVPPLTRLMSEAPHLFDPANAESQVAVSEADAALGSCQLCTEPRSPSGWGSPGCPMCSGVQEYCLPIEGHLFSGLLRTPVPPPTQQELDATSPPESRPVSSLNSSMVGHFNFGDDV